MGMGTNLKEMLGSSTQKLSCVIERTMQICHFDISIVFFYCDVLL